MRLCVTVVSAPWIEIVDVKWAQARAEITRLACANKARLGPRAQFCFQVESVCQNVVSYVDDAMKFR